jgi:hypothetical protein
VGCVERIRGRLTDEVALVLLASFNSIPELVAHDAKLRDRSNHPLLLRVNASEPEPGFGIFHEALAVPD